MLIFLTEKVSKLFLILSFFPFVSFGLNSMDTQPHFIVVGFLAFVLLVITGKVFSKSIYIIGFYVIALITLLITSNNFDFTLLRGLTSYFAFYLTLSVTIVYLMRYGIPSKIIIGSNIIYLISALIQTLFESQKNEILNFLVLSNSFGSVSRGVIGLTPEPTIFAIFLFFMTWLILIIVDYNPGSKIKMLIIANLLTILFLTKSSMAFVFLITASFFILYAIRRNKYILIIAILIFLILFLYINVMPYFFPESRFSKLSQIMIGLEGGLIDRIIVMIKFDASINDRILNVFFPYFGFIMNYGLPGGVHSYAETSRELVNLTNGFFWAGLGSNKILSFVGAFVYELGLIAIINIVFFYLFLKDRMNRFRNIELCMLFVLLNSSIPVAFPLIPTIMALMYYKKINSHQITGL